MVLTRVKPRAPLGGLEQAVEGFEEAVGLTGLRPCDDALEVAPHHGRNLLHRLDLGAHDAGAPVQQHLSHDVDLLAFEDLAQLLLVDPRSSGLTVHRRDRARLRRCGRGVGRAPERPASSLAGQAERATDDSCESRGNGTGRRTFPPVIQLSEKRHETSPWVGLASRAGLFAAPSAHDNGHRRCHNVVTGSA
jgi:hypothetical protein